MKTAELVTKYNRIFHTDYCADANAVGCWLFTEGSGTTVDDASTNSNTGNFASSGHPAWSSASVPKTYTPYSVDFASIDYIDVASDASLAIGANGSFVLWAMCDDWSPATENTFYGDSLGSGLDNTIYLSNHPAVGLHARYGGYPNQSGQLYLNYAHSFTDGTWHHIALTWSRSGSTTTLKLYADGVERDSDTTSLSIAVNPAARQFSHNYLYDGAVLVGNISETGDFSRTLSSTEINDIMDNGLKPAGGVTLKKRTFGYVY